MIHLIWKTTAVVLRPPYGIKIRSINAKKTRESKKLEPSPKIKTTELHFSVKSNFTLPSAIGKSIISMLFAFAVKDLWCSAFNKHFEITLYWSFSNGFDNLSLSKFSLKFFS